MVIMDNFWYIQLCFVLNISSSTLPPLKLRDQPKSHIVYINIVSIHLQATQYNTAAGCYIYIEVDFRRKKDDETIYYYCTLVGKQKALQSY